MNGNQPLPLKNRSRFNESVARLLRRRPRRFRRPDLHGGLGEQSRVTSDQRVVSPGQKVRLLHRDPKLASGGLFVGCAPALDGPTGQFFNEDSCDLARFGPVGPDDRDDRAAFPLQPNGPVFLNKVRTSSHVLKHLPGLLDDRRSRWRGLLGRCQAAFRLF